MSARDALSDILADLDARRATMRCQDLVKVLERLGFEVRDGGRAGHKILTHDGIPEFCSAAFTCGHGRNPEIKPAYVRRIQGILVSYQSAIIEYLEKNREH